MNIRAYIWHMNNEQNNSTMTCNGNLISFFNYAKTEKEALKAMGMQVDFMTANYFSECVQEFGMTLENIHMLHGTRVRSKCSWSKQLNHYIVTTESEHLTDKNF